VRAGGCGQAGGPLKVAAGAPDQVKMSPRPRHTVLARRDGPALTWDAAVGAAVLMVAALVAVNVPTTDLTLRSVHDAPSGLPAGSQPDGAHWDRGRQVP
jgi:hypothetical protein